MYCWLCLVVGVFVAHGVFKFMWLMIGHHRELRTLEKYFPSAPGKHWFFGHIDDLVKNLDRYHDYHLEYMGGEKTVMFTLPSKIFIYSIDPSVVKHILKDQFEKYTKPSSEDDYFWINLRRWLGNGIFVAQHGIQAADQGRHWQRTRKIAAAIFTRQNFREVMFSAFLEKSRVLCDVVAQTKEGECVDVQGKFFSFTMDAAMKLFYGRETNTVSNQSDDYAAAYDNAHRNFLLFVYKTMFIGTLIEILPFPLGGLFPKTMGGLLAQAAPHLFHHGREYLRHVAFLERTTDELIETKRNDPDLANKSDLLSLFLNSKDAEGTLMSDPKYSQDLRDIVLNFIIAGRDTTACTLTWALFILATNKDIQEKLAEELSDKLGDRDPTFEDLTPSNLPYLNGVLYESLRLYPPVPEDSKTCYEEDVLPGGAPLSVGSVVLFFPYAMGRDPNRYSDPLKAKPERWIPFKAPNQFEFPVFQAGPRVCLGMTMALLEARLVLAMLVSRFSFTMKEGEAEKIRPALMLTMSATNSSPHVSPDKATYNVWMHANKRKKSS